MRKRRPTAPAPRPRPPTGAAEAARADRAPAPVPAGVHTVGVAPDEAGMRVDRFLAARYPGLSFSHIQRVIRKGELRVNGKRAQAKQRLAAGQAVRIPPLRLEQFQSGRSGTGRETRD